MQSQFPSARGALARRFFGGNKLLKLVPSVHIAVKIGFFELYFLFCLSWRREPNGRVRFHFSAWVHIWKYMYHGYASLTKSTFCLFSLKKEHFFTIF